MAEEMQTTTTTPPTVEKKPIPFGSRLKSAREAMGLERREAAAQLRLSEKVIAMIERDRYPADLPVTFIKGYIRAYAKLLQIPEHEIKRAIEPIKPKPSTHDPLPYTKPVVSAPVTSGNYFMQFLTYLIMFTMLGLVGVWWYTHPKSTAENQLAHAPSFNNASQLTANPQPSAPAFNNNTAQNITPPLSQAAPTSKPEDNNTANNTAASNTTTNNTIIETTNKAPAQHHSATNIKPKTRSSRVGDHIEEISGENSGFNETD